MNYSPKDQINAALRQNFTAFAIKCFNTLNPGRKYRHAWYIEAR